MNHRQGKVKKQITYKKYPDCSVVILSFNTKDITDTCVVKVREAADYCEKTLGNTIHTIVVDNGSSDGTVANLKKKYKDIQILALEENVGVARGYNAGMKVAKDPYILIINSDTYIQKDTLVKSLEYLEKHTQADVLMVHLIGGRGEFGPYGGHVPTPFKTIRWLLGAESITFLKYHIARIYQYNPDMYTHDFPMEWAPTCFFLLRKKVYDTTKGHDESMFLYMEDLEWCKRIKDNGFSIWYTPDITVTHLGGESTAKKMANPYLLKRQIDGLKHYHNVHYPQSTWLVFWFLWFGLELRALCYLLLGRLDQAKMYHNVSRG